MEDHSPQSEPPKDSIMAVESSSAPVVGRDFTSGMEKGSTGNAEAATYKQDAPFVSDYLSGKITQEEAYRLGYTDGDLIRLSQQGVAEKQNLQEVPIDQSVVETKGDISGMDKGSAGNGEAVDTVLPSEQSTAAHEPPKSWSEEWEQPVAGLDERFTKLRYEQVGKPIAVGKASDAGESTQDTVFVGHILPTRGDSNNWHIVLLANGAAVAIGRQHNPGEISYDDTFTGVEPLYYPPGTTKAEILRDMTRPRRYGAASYGSTESPKKSGDVDIKGSIQSATELAGRQIAERRQQRQEIAAFTASQIDKALTPPVPVKAN